MTEREQFEAFITAPPFEREVGRWEESADVAWPGQYREYEVELAWCAWQERAKVATSSSASGPPASPAPPAGSTRPN